MPPKRAETPLETSLRALNSTLLERLRTAEARATKEATARLAAETSAAQSAQRVKELQSRLAPRSTTASTITHSTASTPTHSASDGLPLPPKGALRAMREAIAAGDTSPVSAASAASTSVRLSELPAAVGAALPKVAKGAPVRDGRCKTAQELRAAADTSSWWGDLWHRVVAFFERLVGAVVGLFGGARERGDTVGETAALLP